MYLRIADGDLGVLDYVLREDVDARVIAGTMIGDTLAELHDEFERHLRLRPGLPRPLLHLVISEHPDDPPTSPPHAPRVRELMTRSGFGRAPWVALLHPEPKPHVHVIAARFDLDGMLLDRRRERTLFRRLARDIEQRDNLAPTPERADARSTSEAERAYRRALDQIGQNGQTVPELYRASIDWTLSLRRPATMTDFAKWLYLDGIEMRLRRSGDEVVGVSYAVRKGTTRPPPIRASRLGAAYTWEGLQTRRGISYDPERDRLDWIEDPIGAWQERRERGIAAPSIAAAGGERGWTESPTQTDPAPPTSPTPLEELEQALARAAGIRQLGEKRAGLTRQFLERKSEAAADELQRITDALTEVNAALGRLGSETAAHRAAAALLEQVDQREVQELMQRYPGDVEKASKLLRNSQMHERPR